MATPPEVTLRGRAGSPARSRIPLFAPVGAAAAVAASAWALHVRDPNVSGSWGFCPWRLLTGFDCPGCGGLRAVHALTDGDIAAAASSNVLLVLAVPVGLVVWWLWLRRAWQGRSLLPAGPSTALVVVGLAVLAVFTVVRNLPVGAWLAS